MIYFLNTFFFFFFFFFLPENSFTEAVLQMVDEEQKSQLLEKVFPSSLLSGVS